MVSSISIQRTLNPIASSSNFFVPCAFSSPHPKNRVSRSTLRRLSIRPAVPSYQVSTDVITCIFPYALITSNSKSSERRPPPPSNIHPTVMTAPPNQQRNQPPIDLLCGWPNPALLPPPTCSAPPRPYSPPPPSPTQPWDTGPMKAMSLCAPTWPNG